MALTRKFLSAMGIEAEKIDEIISAHTETVNALKNERDSFKDKAEEYADLEKKLKDTEKELENLKSEKDGQEEYKEKYDSIKAEYDKYKSDIENEKTHNAKENAYKALLKEAGISEKRIDKITRLAELDKIELDKDGKIKKADELKKSITEEWGEFITTEGKKGADVSKPPQNDGDDNSVDTSAAKERVARFMADRYGTVKKED